MSPALQEMSINQLSIKEESLQELQNALQNIQDSPSEEISGDEIAEIKIFATQSCCHRYLRATKGNVQEAKSRIIETIRHVIFLPIYSFDLFIYLFICTFHFITHKETKKEKRIKKRMKI